MRQLDVTDEQYASLEGVREALESEYLGPYGRVDLQDALQYLLDVHEAADPDLPRTDAAVVQAASSEEAAGPAPGETSAEADEGEAVPATTAGTNPGDGTDASADGEGTDAPTEAGASSPDADAVTDDDTASDDPGPNDAGDAGSDGAGKRDGDAGRTAVASAGPGTGDNDRLQAMMNLLDTHDGKWREGDGDGRYEVDLPDGSTETVQTRDDVRAVLFKNYR
jgi:hypothetical protein